MAIVEPSTGGKAPVLEDDIYNVVCSGVEEKYVEEDKYNNHDKLVIHLTLLDVRDEEGEEITLDPQINRKWSEKATLFSYAVALGIDADPAFAIDTDQFVGREARAVVETPEPGKWPRVKSLMPAKKPPGNSRTTARPVAPPAAADGAVMEIGDWWALTRKEGFERIGVIEKSKVMFGEEPPNISPAERTALLEELRKG